MHRSGFDKSMTIAVHERGDKLFCPTSRILTECPKYLTASIVSFRARCAGSSVRSKPIENTDWIQLHEQRLRLRNLAIDGEVALIIRVRHQCTFGGGVRRPARISKTADEHRKAIGVLDSF